MSRFNDIRTWHKEKVKDEKRDTRVELESKDRLFKIEKIFSNPWGIFVAALVVYHLIFHGLIYTYHFFTHLGALVTGNSEEFSLKQGYNLKNCPFGMMALFFFIALFCALWMAWKLYVNYRDQNVHQKGSARWTTEAEIKEQYKEIPDGHRGDADFYDGGGGVPVHRNGDKLYIDDSPVNNMIIGITRSGKGEMLVFPMIDIYSRAGKNDLSKRASMVISDPKLELYANSYDTLKRRGYDVYCLNLVDPIKSMGYNPLQLVIESYKKENYDDAEMLANTFAFSIFNPAAAGGNDKFWSTESANLCVAMIFGILEDCLREDKYENVKNLKIYMDKRENWNNLSDAKKADIKEQIASAKTFSDLLKLDALPESVAFVPSHRWEKQINMRSVYNTMTELARITDSQSGGSALDDYFGNRPFGDRAKSKYSAIELAGDQTKGSIFASCLAELAIFSYSDIAKMTSHTKLNIFDVGFGKKPVAIFLGIPDYDQSNHFIATVFIRQLYFALAKRATATPSGKCSREVIFLLDEFGNLPAIEGMESIITVCLGRNIRFDLVVQSYAQLEQKYNKGADTIIGNCSNQIFIATNDKQTAENYSALLGNKTLLTVSRSGQRLNIDKSFTESYEERPLLNSNELMELKEGECVVKRVVKRQDLNHNKVTPTPIYNHGKTALTFRWQYLQTDDPTNHADLNARNPEVAAEVSRNTDKNTEEYKERLKNAEILGIPEDNVKREDKHHPAWLFPSFRTVDSIDYDKSVEDTRMPDITFNIYHFCTREMRRYKDKGKLQENFDDLCKRNGGDKYEERHTVKKIEESKIKFCPPEVKKSVFKILKPYMQGIQMDDPNFLEYSFDDCYWKLYKAYEDNFDRQHFKQFCRKFRHMEFCFRVADKAERTAVKQRFPDVENMVDNICSELYTGR